jgi:Ca-activated chloride channel homolog
MSFLSPWRLLLLGAPLILIVAYIAVQRARQKYAVRFTSVELLASVAPRRPGWQRHIPAVALSLALVVLVIGFARPTHSVRIPRQRAAVLLALDTSNSMGASDVSPNRLAAAQQAARRFVNDLPAGIQVGLVSFDRNARLLVSPTTDRAAVLRGIDALTLGPGTATGDAIYLALDSISSLPTTTDKTSTPAIVVLMSDGTPTIGRGDETPEQTVADAAAAAKKASVPVDTIAYGTDAGTVLIENQIYPVPADPAAMAKIADATGGKSFTAQTSNQLASVYNQIRNAVGYDTQQRELTVWFTGLGLVVVIIAGVGALIWTQRLV